MPRVLLIALLFGLCGWTAVHAAGPDAQIDLPDYPFWPNDTYTVSEPLIRYQAGRYCADAPEPSAEQFFLGDLAYGSFDALCQAPAALLDELLGNLYLSGYFGGLWLRDSLDEAQAAQLVQQFEATGGPEAAAGDLLDWLIFQGLAGATGDQVTLAQTAGDLEVLWRVRQAIPGMLSLFGYNVGYINTLLENPPDGVIPDPDVFTCGDYFLDCQGAYVNLAILDHYRPALDHLQTPDSPAWRRMDQLVETKGVPAEQVGRAVWEAILVDHPIAPAAYEPLLNLSAGFLLVSEASALASMTAWAEGQPDVGRCSLLLNAGMTTWGGAYFLGLMSNTPAGLFPELTC